MLLVEPCSSRISNSAAFIEAVSTREETVKRVVLILLLVMVLVLGTHY
jgi:hypothetical protein